MLGCPKGHLKFILELLVLNFISSHILGQLFSTFTGVLFKQMDELPPSEPSMAAQTVSGDLWDEASISEVT